MIVVLSKFFAPYRHDMFVSWSDKVYYAYSSDGHRSWVSKANNRAYRIFSIRTKNTEYTFLWPTLNLLFDVLKADTLVVNSLFILPVLLLLRLLGKKIIYLTDIHPAFPPKQKLRFYMFLFSSVVTNVPVEGLRTKVIPLATDFYPPNDALAIEFDVLFVNQLIERKNIEFIRRFIARCDNLKICVIGDGIFFPELKSNHVVWKKSINYKEIGKFYKASKILCAPSFFDVWGLNVQEALISGCYVLSTDNVGAAYYFKNLKPVYIFNSYNETDWLNCIGKIINSYEKPEKLNFSEFQLNAEFLRNAINILHSR